MRQLVTVRTIGDIRPIPDADAIEVASVDGWDVVVKRGEFAVGDKCVYFEIDSMLPESDPRFAFLMPRGVRETPEGQRGHVLRTAKLRGQVSQGLVMPVAEFPELDGADDLAAVLGVIKWEPPLPAGAAGTIIGPFPSWIPKTDEERVQNLDEAEVAALLGSEQIVVTEKVDGSSHTAFIDDDGSLGVCSRNWRIGEDSEAYRVIAASPVWKWLQEQAAEGSRRVYVQGELVGEGVQGNPLKLRGRRWMVFTLGAGWGKTPPRRWPEPVRGQAVPMAESIAVMGKSRAELIAAVDGMRSALGDVRAEGIVIRGYSNGLQTGSFKVISNTYLLKAK